MHHVLLSHTAPGPWAKHHWQVTPLSLSLSIPWHIISPEGSPFCSMRKSYGPQAPPECCAPFKHVQRKQYSWHGSTFHYRH